MKLNTTSQYAIRILTLIVKSQERKLYSAKEISGKLSIPYKYLTKIMTQLVEAGIISSVRGREGGYSLAKEPSQINIIDILESVKECINGTECLLGVGLCNEQQKCILHDRWVGPKKLMLDMFKKTTLLDMKSEADKL